MKSVVTTNCEKSADAIVPWILREGPNSGGSMKFGRRDIVMKAENRKEAGCTCKGRLETESGRGARSGDSLERTEENGAVSLLAKVLERENLNRVYQRVKKNGGAPGIDGMTTDELLEFCSYST
jgi:hypothetical protein